MSLIELCRKSIGHLRTGSVPRTKAKQGRAPSNSISWVAPLRSNQYRLEWYTTLFLRRSACVHGITASPYPWDFNAQYFPPGEKFPWTRGATEKEEILWIFLPHTDLMTIISYRAVLIYCPWGATKYEFGTFFTQVMTLPRRRVIFSPSITSLGLWE